MTELRVDIDSVHPVSTSLFELQATEKKMAQLEEEEQSFEDERLSLVGVTDNPNAQSRLEKVEHHILRLQTCQQREAEKIATIVAELPALREETERRLVELNELQEWFAEKRSEIEKVDRELQEFLDGAEFRKLQGLAEKRDRLRKDLETWPYSFGSLMSFFHLQPTANSRERGLVFNFEPGSQTINPTDVLLAQFQQPLKKSAKPRTVIGEQLRRRTINRDEAGLIYEIVDEPVNPASGDEVLAKESRTDIERNRAVGFLSNESRDEE